MGVHGLTTFLRENKNRLSSTLTFSSSNFIPDGGIDRTPLVVDAWSCVCLVFTNFRLTWADHASNALFVATHRFLYKLFQDSGLPWVYGGEYDAIVQLIVRIVGAWIQVGLRPVFVFDGTPSAHAEYLRQLLELSSAK